MDLSTFQSNGKYGYKDGFTIVIPAQYEAASSFHEGYAIAVHNNLFGIIDAKGDFIIENKYDDLYHLFSNYYAARINTGKDEWKCGVIDTNNKIVIPFEYKCIQSKDEKYFLCYRSAISKTEDLRYLSLHGRYSYTHQSECNWYNLEGTFLTALDVVNTNKTYLIVKNQSNKFGAIHSDGYITINPKYDTLEYCADDVFLATNERDNIITSSIVGSNDNVIYSTLSDIVFKDGFFLVSSVKQDEQWISVDGKVTYVGHATPLSSKYLKVYKNKKCGVLDKNGEKVINYLYDDIKFCNSFFVVRREDCIGLVGLKGEIVLDTVYKKLESISIENNPLFLGSEKTLGRFRWGEHTVYNGYCKEYCFDTVGHTNYNGKPCDYLCRSIISLNNRYNNYLHETEYNIGASDTFDLTKPIILRNSDYCELFTVEDGIIQNSRFDEIQQITQLCYVVKKNDKFGIYRIDESAITIPIEYDQIQFFGGHTVLLRKDNMWGAKSLVLKKNIFHLFTKVDVPLDNYEIKILDDTQFHFGVKRVNLNYNGEEKTYYTIVNTDGKEVDKLQELYLEDNFTRFDDNHYLTKQNGKCGFVSRRGYVSIPFVYDEILNRKTGSFNVRIGDAWGVIDLSGKELVRVKYAHPIPLYIAAPKNSHFDYDFLKDDIAKDVERYKDRIIVRDALSGCLGCLDMKGNEVIPTVYQHLQFDDTSHKYNKELPGDFLFFGHGGTLDSEHSTEFSDPDVSTFFSSIVYGTWGCLNYDGKIIIDAKYSCLRVTDNFIIAARDVEVTNDIDNYNLDEALDLYTFDGEFLIGGFRQVLYDPINQVYAFFFGGAWESYCSYEDEWNGIKEYSVRFKRNNDLWLILDRDLNTIIRNPDNSQHQFSKGFIGKIEKKKEDSKIKHIYNMPISLMSKGFKCFGMNCAIVKDSNSDDAKVAALDFKTGSQTPFHESIEQITDDLFFFSDERKSGIRTISDIVIPADYLFFTKPDNGYFFGAKELDDGNSSLTLFHIDKRTTPIATAIESVKTSSLISDLAYGRLKLDFYGGDDLTNARVPKSNIFSEDFLKLVDDTESNYFVDKWKNPYYFGTDYRIGAEDYYEPDYSDDRDYMRDSWDAMTDGMYGDMPDGFDGDFDFLGR